MEAVVENGNKHYYNSVFLFGEAGRLVESYRKQHLVLFGEYLPFDRYLPFLKTLAPLGISCSAGTTGTVFRLQAVPLSVERGDEPGEIPEPEEVRFASLICFEDAFPGLARRAVLNGARVLINQTNDAWFDGWLAPGWAARQHMSHCVFRCVENRVPAVRCANTGVTCSIDRNGRIENLHLLEKQHWRMGITGFSVHTVAVTSGTTAPTFYTRYGDLPFALPCGMAAALAFILAVADERRKNTEP
jgi:apolipoprotein N-acyltransferase